MKKPYRMKKTLSMRQFIEEQGGAFSGHVKQRLLELGERCVLTRKDESFILDLKHIEHTKYSPEDGSDTCQKEYAFGQLIVHEGVLYFSQSCLLSDEIMQSPISSNVYTSLDSEVLALEGDIRAKKVDDSNIDFIIDSIFTVCPKVSPEHLAIVSRY